MRKKINLVYWSEENFGDALSPVLVEELSGLKTQLKHAYKSKFRRFIKSILYVSPREFSTILFPWNHNILGVGSVICCGNKRSKVWGSGFMSDAGEFKGGKIFAVRGPGTAKRLENQGYPKCRVYGDPALLLPLWKQPVNVRKHKLGIVPHWKESESFLKKYGSKHKIIDLRTRDINRVIEEMTSCDYILSTSLHGVIVAHAYDIPALWIKEGYIETDGFKFADYFNSVGIPNYVGFGEVETLLAQESNWMQLFDTHREKAKMHFSLQEIQRKLLKAAPFPLRDKYNKIAEGL